jgi:hypothetical protein
MPWSGRMCHVWSPMAAGCDTRAARSGRPIPGRGGIHLPRHQPRHPRRRPLLLDVAWPGVVSCRSWTQAPLPHLLVAHTEEALIEAPEQHGCAAMEIEVVAPTMSPAQSKVAPSLLGCTDGASSQVISRKRGGLFSDEAGRCRRRVFPGMVAFGTMESGSLDAEEGPFGVHRSPCPSDALRAHNVEDSLPAPELRLHISIEVVGRLRLVQETRSLSGEKLSLIAFLLNQIFLLKEVMQQQGVWFPL